MPAKDDYCYRILKKYSLLVDYDGVCNRINVPSQIEGETFKTWKIRVLGNETSNVRIFTPATPASQTRISTLQNVASGDHFERMFDARQRELSVKRTVAISDAVVRAEKKYSSIPKETLEKLLEEHDLEPSVEEFFQNFDKEVGDDVKIEPLLQKLISAYNYSVQEFRKKQIHT